MEALQPLSSQAHAVRVGEPLPFGICDAEGRLLLARGQMLQSQGQLEGLLDRGAFIHRDHAAEAVERIRAARPQELPRLWSESAQQLGRVLKAQLDPHFEASLESAARPVVALVQRDPDMAILQVVQPPDTPVSNYANRHALHSAIAGQLAAQRLGWGDDAGKSLFRAALTMNLGMAELQNRLAAQVTPLTALQRQQLHEHPQRSVEILQGAGVNDPLWLVAVAQHHERPDGTGYPRGLGDLGELALLLNRVDAFTARFSARVIRQAMPADAAVRQFFAADPKSPHAAAIVKEFGLYPPGCSVRLKSGEAGIVMRRGATATTPVVAVLTTRNGDPLMQPVKRDTQQADNAVAAVLPAAAIKVRLPVEKLVACCAH